MCYTRDDALNADIYIELRKRVHFMEYAKADVEIALHNSLYSVVVYEDEKPIGIARIVGDDRIVFFIKDVVVDPAYQRMKIGNILMDKLHEYIAKKACDRAYIGLMSTTDCVSFYKKYGFIERPTNELGPGMVKFFNQNEVKV